LILTEVCETLSWMSARILDLASAMAGVGPVSEMGTEGSSGSSSSSESASSSSLAAARAGAAGRFSRRGMSILQPVASVTVFKVDPLGPMIVPKVDRGTSRVEVSTLLTPRSMSLRADETFLSSGPRTKKVLSPARIWVEASMVHPYCS
jgi:hypothetical protein